jgi:aryl-alcohol dehydrogenase-like predicted oxidoreductase/ferredoxin
MKTNKLGNTDIEVTPIGMGVLTIGHNQLALPLARGAGIVRYALDRGINFLDTAQYYETYPYIKKALTGTDHHPVIASKSLVHGYSEMYAAVEEMRKALNIDVIDIFLLHEVRTGDDFENRQSAWTCLNDLKAKNIIKAIGLSTHYIDVAERNAALPESDILFPLINKDSLGIRRYGGPGAKEDMEAAIRRNADSGKGVFTMKVFGGGNLTGSYLEALDYGSSVEGAASMMVGIGAENEVDRLVEYMEGTIDRNYVPDISKKRIRVDQGDCEGCGACIEICPNKAMHRNKSGLAEVDQNICLTCGYCAPVCPYRAIILL